jgi:hypothetical protein
MTLRQQRVIIRHKERATLGWTPWAITLFIMLALLMAKVELNIMFAQDLAAHNAQVVSGQ